MIGPSHRSTAGRILAGGTGERLLSGAPVPVAVAPAGYATGAARLDTVGCGFDGSPESHAALDWAAALARAASARLLVLGVHERMLPAGVAPGAGLNTATLNEVVRRERADELSRVVSALGPEVSVDAEFVDGDAATELARASEELDLLVLGSRGYGPIRAVLLGSVSSALVRSAASPVVVVPRPDDGSGVRSRAA